MGSKIPQLLLFSHTGMVLAEQLLNTQREAGNHNHLQLHVQTAISELTKAFANIRLFQEDEYGTRAQQQTQEGWGRGCMLGCVIQPGGNASKSCLCQPEVCSSRLKLSWVLQHRRNFPFPSRILKGKKKTKFKNILHIICFWFCFFNLVRKGDLESRPSASRHFTDQSGVTPLS